MSRFQEVWAQIASALVQEAFGSDASFLEDGSNMNLCDTIVLGAEFTGLLQGRLIVKSTANALESCKEVGAAAASADWPKLLERITEAAAQKLAEEHGLPVQFKTIPNPVQAASDGFAYTVEIGDRSIPFFIIDETREMHVNRGSDRTRRSNSQAGEAFRESTAGAPGMDLLLDVELEASLRFGSREMPLSQVVELGPGDVVQLDRHISDPVDLVVGDKIVARGEVVLVNGNFGFRVTEVAEPRKRLENIRCLF